MCKFFPGFPGTLSWKVYTFQGFPGEILKKPVFPGFAGFPGTVATLSNSSIVNDGIGGVLDLLKKDPTSIKSIKDA